MSFDEVTFRVVTRVVPPTADDPRLVLEATEFTAWATPEMAKQVPTMAPTPEEMVAQIHEQGFQGEVAIEEMPPRRLNG